MTVMATRTRRRTTVESRLARCAAWAAERLDALERPPTSLAEAPDSQLHVIMRRAGFRRRTPLVQERLKEAFDAHEIQTYPDLTDPSVDRDTRIYFLRGEVADLAHPRVLFDEERLLEDFLVNNFPYLPAFRGLKLRSRQFRFPGSNRVIDLLCEERRGGQLVGIELKHGAPDRGLTSQMIDYMIELERLAKSEGRPGCRGVVVTGQPDARLAEDLHALARSRGFEVDWYLYETSIRLRTRGPNT